MTLRPGNEHRGPYKMGTIAELTGLSPVLLRAWERRYDLLRPMRGPGGHRLYTDDDLRVLRSAQRLIRSGRSIGEIAALGRDRLIREPGRSGTAAPDEAPVRDTADRETLDGPLIEGAVRDAVRAAVDLDAGGINDALDTAAAVVSPARFIEDVIEPAAREIGELWTSGRCSVAGEHLASEVFVDRLRRLLDSASQIEKRAGVRVIAACLPDERHQLGLLILSYFLNRHGVAVLCLGADLPFADLDAAIGKLPPSAVLLSVTRRSTFRRHRNAILEIAKAHAAQTAFYVGGNGAPSADDDLEARGVRLRPATESSREAAARIAGELHESYSDH